MRAEVRTPPTELPLTVVLRIVAVALPSQSSILTPPAVVVADITIDDRQAGCPVNKILFLPLLEIPFSALLFA